MPSQEEQRQDMSKLGGPRGRVNSLSQSISQSFHGPAPRSPLHRLHHDIRVVVAYSTPPMCHVHFTSTSHPLAVHVFGCERCLP